MMWLLSRCCFSKGILLVWVHVACSCSTQMLSRVWNLLVESLECLMGGGGEHLLHQRASIFMINPASQWASLSITVSFIFHDFSWFYIRRVMHSQWPAPNQIEQHKLLDPHSPLCGLPNWSGNPILIIACPVCRKLTTLFTPLHHCLSCHVQVVWCWCVQLQSLVFLPWSLEGHGLPPPLQDTHEKKNQACASSTAELPTVVGALERSLTPHLHTSLFLPPSLKPSQALHHSNSAIYRTEASLATLLHSDLCHRSSRGWRPMSKR